MDSIDKSIINGIEYAFLHLDPRLSDNICLLGLGGSHAYGTYNDHSDIDIRGFATRTPEMIFLGDDYGTIRNTDTDTVIYSADKAIDLLTKCNPNTLEILGLRPQDYFVINDVGQMILDNKSIFLSQQCIRTFIGYSAKQLYRLKQKSTRAMSEQEFKQHIAETIQGMQPYMESKYGLTGIVIYEDDNELKIDIQEPIIGAKLETFINFIMEADNVVKDYYKNSSRNSKAIEHDKIDKHAMHLLRAYMMGIDILEKGEIITHREAEHDILMAVRNGEMTCPDGFMNEDFYALVNEYQHRFKTAAANTRLPLEPDYGAIESLKLKINMDICEKGIDCRRILNADER